MPKIQITVVPQNHWEMWRGILGDDYAGEGIIGKGSTSFGVYLVKHKPSGTYRALKLIQFHDEKESKSKNREIANMGALNHQSIVRFYESRVQGVLLGIFMEFLDGLQLEPYAKSKNLDKQAYSRIFNSILKAEHYVHTLRTEMFPKGIVHLDLKPSNIIMVERNGDFEPVLIDFGLSRAVETDASTTIGGAAGYRAPECIWTLTPTPAMDIFSTGVLLYECFSGGLINPNIQNLRNIARSHFQFSSKIQEYFNQYSDKSYSDRSEIKRKLEQSNNNFKADLDMFKKDFVAQINSAYSAKCLGGEGCPLDKVIRHCIEFEPQDRYKSAEMVRFDMNLAVDSDKLRSIEAIIKNDATDADTIRKALVAYVGDGKNKGLLADYNITTQQMVNESVLLADVNKEMKRKINAVDDLFVSYVAGKIYEIKGDDARAKALDEILSKIRNQNDRRIFQERLKAKFNVLDGRGTLRDSILPYTTMFKGFDEARKLGEIWDLLDEFAK